MRADPLPKGSKSRESQQTSKSPGGGSKLPLLSNPLELKQIRMHVALGNMSKSRAIPGLRHGGKLPLVGGNSSNFTRWSFRSLMRQPGWFSESGGRRNATEKRKDRTPTLMFCSACFDTVSGAAYLPSPGCSGLSRLRRCMSSCVKTPNVVNHQ